MIAWSCDCDRPPHVGQSIELTYVATIKDTGLPYVPATMYAWSKSPSGVLTPLTVTTPIPGTYKALFTPTVFGPWVGIFSDSSTPPNGSNVYDWTWPPIQVGRGP